MGRTGWLAFSVLLAACDPGPSFGDTGGDAALPEKAAVFVGRAPR